ncbi:MAG TPA: (deoxy)nucleoside triphosphate pyrophosphohydrolase [Bacteroidota bacterium]|nr:(deoxy)nucleoside triphosphate pyrophosphohydrolase [Bacteroidota bacterium]
MTRVAVGILRKNGKILACQRKKGSRYGLKWEFPGGKLEPGETPLQCLQRELREELSIDVNKVQKMEFQSAFYDDGGMFEVAYCHVSDFSGDPQNNVFESIRWVDAAELRRLDILEGNRSFVDKLDAHER